MSRIRRLDILRRRAEVETWIAEHRSKAFICAQLACRPLTFEGILRHWNISYAGNRGGKRQDRAPKPAADFLKKGSRITSYKLKLKLLREKLKEERCEACGLSTWMGQTIPLELHHTNGDRHDNRLPNLKILCPNCHALTPNNSGRASRKRTLESVA